MTPKVSQNRVIVPDSNRAVTRNVSLTIQMPKKIDIGGRLGLLLHPGLHFRSEERTEERDIRRRRASVEQS